MTTPSEVMQHASEIDQNTRALREEIEAANLTLSQQLQLLAYFQSSWEASGTQELMGGHSYSEFLYGTQTAWNLAAEALSGDDELLS